MIIRYYNGSSNFGQSGSGLCTAARRQLRLPHGKRNSLSKLGLSHKQRNTLLSRRGVGTRINSPEFLAGLDRLRTDWSMDAPQLVTFMSDSVAARIDSPEFWAGLDRLRTEWGMDMPQLVKFMGNSVAARIRSPELWAGLDRLRTEWGMNILKPCGPSPPPCLLVAGSAFCNHRNMIENHCSEGGRPSHSSSKHPISHRRTTSKIIDQKGEDSRRFFQSSS